MMPSDHTIEQLRQEFSAHQLEGFLWEWTRDQLIGIARARIVGRYSPSEYSPSGAWDSQALTDLANDFIAGPGIQNGVIYKALVRSTDLRAFLGYLGTSFQHFVVNQRPKSTSRNVFDRLRDRLDSSPEFARLAGLPPYSYFGRADWNENPPEVADEEDLLFAERFIPDDIRWYAYETGERQSPGLSSADLQRIVIGVLNGVRRLVSAQQLMAIIRRRFDLDGAEVVMIGMSGETAIRAPSASPLESIAAQEIARQFVQLLTDRQRRILFEVLDQGGSATRRSIATTLKISKSTVDNELSRIYTIFRELDVSGENQMEQVLNVVDKLRHAS